VADTHLSRRTFLLGATTVAAAAAVPVGLTLGAGSAAAAPLTRSTFTPLLGSTLRMSNGHRTKKVVLADISDLPKAAKANDEHCFSLLFETPAGTTLPQALRSISHHDIGTVPLLIVPVDRGKAHQWYQAVINSPHQHVKNPTRA
jgi:hypothetical protein